MTPEYQLYHGAVLHEIINRAGREIKISLKDFHGRPDAYVLDGRVGLLIKHSTARLTPWFFTFAKDHIGELLALRQETSVCFVVLVCGLDGLVCIRDSELIKILTPTDSDVLSVRVDRRRRKMYRISCSGNELDGKLARGIADVLDEIDHTTTSILSSASLSDTAALLDMPKP